MHSPIRLSQPLLVLCTLTSCTLVATEPRTCAPCVEDERVANPPPDVAPASLDVPPASPHVPPASRAPDCYGAINLALNPDRLGLPSPLQSERGWGGGANIWELVDGKTSYDSWDHGLAFTGGHNGPGGGEPWVEPAGPRQATIDFGRPTRFDRVIIWNHGDEHTPADVELEVFRGQEWEPLPFKRVRATAHAEGSGSGNATADTYSFPAVTGSRLRYRFDNRGRNVNGTWNVHGWLYELEVFHCGPQLE